VSRLATGGRIDRTAPLRFTVDGTSYPAFRGDTVASALVAADALTVGPSLYRRRPRGVLTAGVDEPNALLDVAGELLPATTVDVVDGLAVNTRSGVGRLRPEPDTARYDKTFAFADVAVVGGGPAGLAAALAASAGGARVLMVDDQPELGGDLLAGNDSVDGMAGSQWVAAARETLRARPEVRVLSRAGAVGYYDDNYLLVAQRRTGRPGSAAQRLWHVRAKWVVLATGAHERSIVFADNDRPGIMLASAVRDYLTRYAALAGQNAVVCTTNDSAYPTALQLRAAGARVVAVVDTRTAPPRDLVGRAEVAGIRVLSGMVVHGTQGPGRISGVTVSRLDRDDTLVGPSQDLACDLLAVSGGWNPAVHLFSQSTGTLRWDGDLAAFRPAHGGRRQRVVGAANGTYPLADCLREGTEAGAEAAEQTGFPAPAGPVPTAARRRGVLPRPVWLVPGTGDPGEWRDHFVDLQRDGTVADIWRATRAGMRSVEHIKRYTTIGTGQDQGRGSGVLASGVIAEALGVDSPGSLGTTTFRPPYQPVSFALLAGRDRGPLADPVRTTPMHGWHVAAGAVFENVGQWKRPWYYPRAGEDMETAVWRECLAARTGVALMDASTLGKIEVLGADAGEFLNRIYTNGMKKLPVGSARYGLMCTADGMVLDDGVVLRLAEDRYYLTTTTGGAAKVLDWLEEWSQTEWPELDVACTSVTEQWSTIAVVGPDARQVVGRLAPGLDVSVVGFPFMTFRDTVLGNGITARIARISFSGELAYEVNVAGWFGAATWESVLAAGADLDITPYGTETMDVLRAEKGFPIVGQDTDGTVTPQDLGMDWVVSTRKQFVGRRSHQRADAVRSDRKHLVGLLPVDRTALLPEGAQLVEPGAGTTDGRVPMLGHVTSSYRSAILDRTFALALVRDGRNRIGQTLLAPLVDKEIAVVVTEPVGYDQEGHRRDG
jgi:sarcosine oxidase subunit alpha